MTRAERQARRLLAAYPWRVRAEQGDEIVATVLDALPPDADRLSWRVQLELLRGGRRMRSQRRPPWLTVVAYVSGVRIAPRWIWWIYDELEDPDHVRNRRWRIGVGWGAVLGVLALVLDRSTVLVSGGGCLIASIWLVPRDRERQRARYGLLPGGSDPDQVWVRRTRRGIVPDVPVAPAALAVGAALVAGATACTVAMASSAPRWDDAGLEVTIHPAVHVGPRHLAVVGLGLAAGLLVARAGARRERRSAPVAPPVAPRATALVAALTGGGLAVALGVLALTLRWRWVSPLWAYGVGVIGPVGLGLFALGARTAWTGRRRGQAVGVWDVLPRLGPRRRVDVVRRQLLSLWPDAELLVNGEDDR